MNSDRRHELQENELAAHLARVNKAIEPYSKLIAVVVGAVVLGVIALALYQSKSSGDRSDATLALIDASMSEDPSDLSQIAATYPTTSAAAWAKLYEGNSLLTQAMQSLFVDRTAAEDSIREARAAYNSALASSDDRIIRSRAHFGLARASEALGEVETAISEYKLTVDADESESMVALARRRIESLESPETQDFVEWFAEQDFAPADPTLPPSLPTGSSLSDTPDVELPDLDEGLTSEDESAPLADGGLEMPADGANAEAAADDDADPAESTDQGGDGKDEGDRESAASDDTESTSNDSSDSKSDDE
tara:strand:- start:23184 stop:24107 length:924 start_codon:yes stop_codon:yes gene_type:complete